MTLLRAGLVGCGRIGALSEERVARWPIANAYLPYSHASALAAARDLEFVAACDASEAAAMSVARKHGVRAYTSLEAMLQTERLDILSIATRTPSRPQVIDLAIKHGVRALFCEKPIANSIEETDRLAAAIRGARVAFAYGTKRRFMSAYIQARDLAQSGAIGAVQTIVVRFGKGALLWNHPHSVDIACFMAGDRPVTHVEARLSGIEWSGPNEIRSDPTLEFGRITFAGGVSAFILPVGGQDVEIVGETGVVTVASDGTRLIHRRQSGPDDLGWWLQSEELPINAGVSGTVVAIENLARQLASNDIEDGVGRAVTNQEVLFGFCASEQAGGTRADPFVRRGLTVAGITGGNPA